MISHGVGYSDVYHSVWEIVDTINLCDNLKIYFSTSHEEQRELAVGMSSKFWLNVDNYMGCVDGILI